MKRAQLKRSRPDIDAAVRGGDWTQAMDGEGVPGQATMEQAVYWRQIYTEILGMEEKVLKRIRQLMATQSAEARREVELTKRAGGGCPGGEVSPAPRLLGGSGGRAQRSSFAQARARRTGHHIGQNLVPVVRRRHCGSGINFKEVLMRDQIRGKAEEMKGKVTGDRGEEMKGKARQAVGDVKRTVRDVKRGRS